MQSEGSSILSQSQRQEAAALAGTRTGAYELVEEIGRGGMGVVYRAVRRDGEFDRAVAVKLLRPGADAEQAVERFRRERQILAALDHPNIAALLDGGVTADGAPYFIMELVEGQRIDRWCDARGLDLRERLALFRRVCLAVHHAHRHLVIHRDIKPANVLVDGDGTPKLLDFGIAKLLSPDGDATATSPETRAMTLEYASPEQIRGEPLTTATDVYSLGVLACHLVTGRSPYHGAGDSLQELVAAICDVEPAAPSALAPAAQRRALRGDVDTIVLRALRKEPAARYESARALADDVGRFLAGEPVLARRAGIAYRVAKRLRRHPVATAIGAAALVVAALAVGVGAHARRQAALRESLARELGAEVERIEWIMRTAEHLPLHAIAGEKAMVRQRMAAIENRMRSLGGAAEGAGQYALGRGHLSLGEWDGARDALERAWEAGYRRPEAAYARGLVLASLYSREKSAADRMGTPQARAATLAAAAAAYRDPALALLREGRAAGLAPELVAGIVARLEGRYDEAVRWAREAVRAVPWLQEALVLEGDAWMDVVVQHRDAGDRPAEEAAYRDAEAAYRAAVRIAPSDARAQMRLLYLAKQRLVRKLGAWGEDPTADWALAEAAGGAALEVDPAFAETYRHLAEACNVRAEVALNRGEDPRPMIERSIATTRRGLAAAPAQATTEAALGTALSLRARWLSGHGQDPRPDLAAAMEAFRRGRALEPSNLAVLVNMGNAARILAEHQMTHGEDPEPALREAGECFRAAVALVPDAPNFANNLGIVHNDLGAWRLAHGEDARADLEEAVRAHERALALNPGHSFAANNLGNDQQQLALLALATGGDPEPASRAAEAAFRRAIAADPDNAIPHLNLVYLYRWRAEHARLGGGEPDAWLAPAEACFAEAVRRNPEQIESYPYLAGAYLVAAESELDHGRSPATLVGRARTTLRRGLEIDPGNAESHQLAGRAGVLEARWALAVGRRPDAALAAAGRELERAAATNGNDATIWRDLAELHRTRLDALLAGVTPDRAAAAAAATAGLAAADRALAVNPALAEALLSRGALHLAAARAAHPDRAAAERAAARSDLERAVDRNPRLAAAARPLLEETTR